MYEDRSSNLLDKMDIYGVTGSEISWSDDESEFIVNIDYINEDLDHLEGWNERGFCIVNDKIKNIGSPSYYKKTQNGINHNGEKTKVISDRSYGSVAIEYNGKKTELPDKYIDPVIEGDYSSSRTSRRSRPAVSTIKVRNRRSSKAISPLFPIPVQSTTLRIGMKS